MIQFLFGLFIGLVSGVLAHKFWDEITEKAQEVQAQVTEQDPEDVQRRMNSVNAFVRKYALVIVIGLIILAVMATVVLTSVQPRTVQLGSYILLTDKCGETHNVQIEAAHVNQGFVLVAPGTDCELKQPLVVPK